MGYILETKPGVEISVELYAPDIRIKGNPEDKLAGSIQLELHKLEYHGEQFVRMDPLANVGETVADFVQRTFNVNEKEITGYDVMLVVEQYAAMIYKDKLMPLPESAEE